MPLTIDNNNAFRLNEVARRFSSDRGIGPLSLELDWGQICSIIGANGSGKTTLLRCITMLEQMDSGTVHVINHTWSRSDFLSQNIQKEISSLIGIVFQNPEPWPHLNVMENLTLPLTKVKKLSQQESIQKAEETLIQFGLLDRAKSLPHQLSGGLRQRVVAARVFAMQPRVLILDEPTSALDPEWTEKIGHLITSYAKKDNIVIIVSHQMNFVSRVSDWIVYLNGGCILEQGNPERILRNPTDPNLQKFLKNV